MSGAHSPRGKKGKKSKKGRGKDKDEGPETPKGGSDLVRAPSNLTAHLPPSQQQRQVVVKPDLPSAFTIGSTVVQLSHYKMPNEEEFYDLELQFVQAKHKGSKVRAHKFVIDQRCPDIIKEGVYVGKVKKKKHLHMYTLNEDLLPRMTPAVLTEILHWVYTDYIDFSNKSLDFVLDVCATASNFDLPPVVWLCEHHLRSVLSLETSYLLLRGANERQLDRVKNFTLEFAFSHWEEFIASKTGAKSLGLDLYQEVTTMFTTSQKITCPELEKPPSNIIADWKTIHDTMPNPDVQIKVGEVYFPCHKAVLAAHSMALQHALQSVGPVSIKKKKVILPNFVLAENIHDPQAVERLLSFIYYGDKSIPALSAVHLIHFANRRYMLHDVQILCEWVISQNIRVETALPILGVSYLEHLKDAENMHQLRGSATQFIVRNVASIDLSPLKAMPSEVRFDILLALQASIKDGVYVSNGAGGPRGGGAARPPPSMPAVAAPKDSDEDTGDEGGDDVIVI